MLAEQRSHVKKPREFLAEVSSPLTLASEAKMEQSQFGGKFGDEHK